jgi:secreted trypsin-like serine protease
MMKSVAYKILGTGLLASTLIGCGTAAQNSETKVTNGREIAESTFPSVVLLVMELPEGQGICTGTFVNDSQVVTAGHCVEGLNPANPTLYYARQTATGELEGVQALNFVRNPRYNINLGVSPYDVSVVNFKPGTAPATSPRATRAPFAGETLTIVGYGNNVNSFDSWGQLTGSGAGTKRAGTNKVGSVSGGFINFNGLPESDGLNAQGTLVSSGSGDSGGPLFVNGALAGVTSGGGLSPDGRGGYIAVSKYVDLNNTNVKPFLDSQLKK